MPTDRATVQLSAYVEPDLMRAFDAAAVLAGVSRSEAVRLAAEDFIEAVSLHSEGRGEAASTTRAVERPDESGL